MTATAPDQPLTAAAGVAANRTAEHQGYDYATYPTAREKFTAWLIASCERQGISVTITDPNTLAAIATLLH